MLPAPQMSTGFAEAAATQPSNAKEWRQADKTGESSSRAERDEVLAHAARRAG